MREVSALPRCPRGGSPTGRTVGLDPAGPRRARVQQQQWRHAALGLPLSLPRDSAWQQAASPPLPALRAGHGHGDRSATRMGEEPPRLPQRRRDDGTDPTGADWGWGGRYWFAGCSILGPGWEAGVALGQAPLRAVPSHSKATASYFLRAASNGNNSLTPSSACSSQPRSHPAAPGRGWQRPTPGG